MGAIWNIVLSDVTVHALAFVLYSHIKKKHGHLWQKLHKFCNFFAQKSSPTSQVLSYFPKYMLNSSPIWEWDHNFNHQILDNTSCIANFFFQNIVIGIKCQNMDMRACGLCSVDYVDAWSLMFFTKTFIRLVAVVMSMVVWATLLLLALQLSKKWTFYYVSGGGFLWRWWTNNRWGAWRFEG